MNQGAPRRRPKGEGSISRVEWRVVGDPGPGYPPYDFKFDDEDQARGFIRLVQSAGNEWAAGPHLETRTVIETPWTRDPGPVCSGNERRTT